MPYPAPEPGDIVSLYAIDGLGREMPLGTGEVEWVAAPSLSIRCELQYQAVTDGIDLDSGMWLRYPKPRDAMERLAHAVDLMRLRVRLAPEKEEKLRNQVAVHSPLEEGLGSHGHPQYGLTFGDMDDLYRRLRVQDAGQGDAAQVIPDTNE